MWKGWEKQALFSLERRQFGGDLIAFQYLKGAYRKAGGRLFTKHVVTREEGMVSN